MKLLIIPIIASTLLIACNTQGGNGKDNAKVVSTDSVAKMMKDSSSFTTLQWIDSVNIDLGKLKQGKEVEITWRFKNTGKNNLIIEAVSASCGCTIPEKPENVIEPGKEGVIKAKFNGSGFGPIVKQVHVSANTLPDNQHTLGFTGEIVTENSNK